MSLFERLKLSAVEIVDFRGSASSLPVPKLDSSTNSLHSSTGMFCCVLFSKQFAVGQFVLFFHTEYYLEKKTADGFYAGQSLIGQ